MGDKNAATSWRRTKAGNLYARTLPVRAGVPCSGIVKRSQRGLYSFLLVGRGGRELGGWQNGFDTEQDAAAAAEKRAGYHLNE